MNVPPNNIPVNVRTQRFRHLILKEKIEGAGEGEEEFNQLASHNPAPKKQAQDISITPFRMVYSTS